MDRTGQRDMGRLDDDYKPNMMRNRVSTDPQSADRNCSASHVLHSKLRAIDVCRHVREFVVTLRSHKRMVPIVSMGHQTQRRIALGLAITPWLAHSMLRLLVVSGA